MAHELIAIGQIVGAHGVFGEVRVYPLTDFPERFLSTSQVFLGSRDQIVEIEDARLHKNIVLCRIKGICDRAAVDRLRGTYLYVLESDTVKLPQDTFYTWRLIGCNVTGPEGNVGTVKDVITGSGNDLLVVDCGTAKIVYIPFVREFVKHIDLDARSIVIAPIPGLLE